MGLKIFVTGASGFIGKVFLSRLLKSLSAEDAVLVLAKKEPPPGDPRVKYLVGRLEEIENFKEEILESNYFFHIAALASFGDDLPYHKINFEPTQKAVNILKDSHNLKNFIFLSTIGAVDRRVSDDCGQPLNTSSVPSPRSAYGQSKFKAEEYIKKSGIPFTIIRPTWVYGKNMRADSHINKFVSMAYQHSPVFKLNFPGKVSLIHVEDLSQAMVNCLNNPCVINKTYFAETESLPLGKILGIIFKEVRKTEVKQINVPSFRWFFGRIHSLIPLIMANLFIDYLCAEDNDFKKELLNIEAKTFSSGVKDVTSTNVYGAGYWVITGANSGIGYALADKLNQKNFRLILIDKNIDKIGRWDNHIVFQADLSDENKIKEIANRINNYKIFRLVNNAGLGYKNDFVDMAESEIINTIKVNVTAPVLLTKLLAENIIQNHGAVVNIASSAAYNPLPGMALYAASKSFILGWSSSLWYELKAKCSVITFSPSGTNTNFQKSAGVKNDGKGLLTPEEVAVEIMAAVEKGRPFVLVGVKNRVANLVCKFLPTKFNVIFWGKMFKKMR